MGHYLSEMLSNDAPNLEPKKRKKLEEAKKAKTKRKKSKKEKLK
jgi:hypothetical protein